MDDPNQALKAGFEAEIAAALLVYFEGLRKRIARAVRDVIR
jgi:hypothetical protein